MPRECEANGETVAELVRDLEQQFPGVSDYLVHENGKLRQHVNIFVGDRLVLDREQLSDKVGENENLVIMQALSGG